jgi:hypothetical protein
VGTDFLGNFFPEKMDLKESLKELARVKLEAAEEKYALQLQIQEQKHIIQKLATELQGYKDEVSHCHNQVYQLEQERGLKWRIEERYQVYNHVS